MSRSSRPAGGLVVVDKPAGMTSHDVVGRVRRLAGTRKVGHAGTLDPMATGVLVLGLERATRLLGHLVLTEKHYRATVRLGMTTTTDDAEGDVLATTPAVGITDAALRSSLAHFIGEIDQVPATVSAIKVDGRRAYQRVREGESVELASRRVTVHDIAVHEVVRPDGAAVTDVDLSVHCSSGTYVRALARDLGAALGVGGHLTALRRTAVGAFDLTVAHTLEQLAEDLAVLPLGDAARRTFPTVMLDAEQAEGVRHGRRIDVGLDRLSAVFAPDGEFLALYEPEGARARAVAVFTG